MAKTTALTCQSKRDYVSPACAFTVMKYEAFRVVMLQYVCAALVYVAHIEAVGTQCGAYFLCFVKVQQDRVYRRALAQLAPAGSLPAGFYYYSSLKSVQLSSLIKYGEKTFDHYFNK